ncbi:Vacuolar protein sorting-associated protein 55 homolog [Linum perenne]
MHWCCGVAKWMLSSAVLAGLAFMFSSSILLQILVKSVHLVQYGLMGKMMRYKSFRITCPSFHLLELRCHSSLCNIQQLVAHVISVPAALMYVVVPMPCLFFGGGSTQFLTSRDGGGWIDAAKFMTGASAVGSLAIPIILRHADMIETGAMFIEFTSFFIFVCTVLCFHRASLEDDW